MAARRPSTMPASDSATADQDTFTGLGVPAPLATTLADAGIHTPFPIQTATLPHSLAGRDVLGRGRTGSGKTYAFALPVLARLAATPAKPRAGSPRALILAPTRELAGQIESAMRPLADALSLRTATVFGGVGAKPQISALRAGVDVLVACPGRLTDHISNGHANLDDVQVTVLDEADHMADLGFLPGVRKLLAKTPTDSQRLLFSATLDSGVDVLVRQFLTDPVTHSVDSEQSPITTMDHHVLHVDSRDRLPVLADLAAAPGRTLVFTRTKHRAKSLTRQLVASGVPSVELHGNLGQTARSRNLLAFSDGTAETLVATDIAARGIHVDDVALVIHADPPVEHKAYLHRSGRTARAGAAGTVITLMTDEQVSDVRDLTRKAGIKPTTTKIMPGDSLLSELAPGERTHVDPPPKQPSQPQQPKRSKKPPQSEQRGQSSQGGKGKQSGRPKQSGQTNSAKQPQQSSGSPSRGRGNPGAAPARRSNAAAFSADTRAGGRRRSR